MQPLNRTGGRGGFTLVEPPAVSRRKRAAFTLVELLVVIGIITLLIAMLLPALSAARDAANRVKCLANLRSMAQAAHLHAADHRGYMPLAGAVGPPFSGVTATPEGLLDRDKRKYMYRKLSSDGLLRPLPLPGALGYYMGLRDLIDHHMADGMNMMEAVYASEPFRARFTCPSQDFDAIRPGRTLYEDAGTLGPRVRMSYVFNSAFLARRLLLEGETPGGRIDRVKSPDSVFLFADGNSGGPGDYAIASGSAIDTFGDYYRGARSWQQFDHERHRRRLNVVFVDGHGETLMMPSHTRPATDPNNGGDLDRAWLCKGLILK